MHQGLRVCSLALTKLCTSEYLQAIYQKTIKQAAQPNSEIRYQITRVSLAQHHSCFSGTQSYLTAHSNTTQQFEAVSKEYHLQLKLQGDLSKGECNYPRMELFQNTQADNPTHVKNFHYIINGHNIPQHHAGILLHYQLGGHLLNHKTTACSISVLLRGL